MRGATLLAVTLVLAGCSMGGTTKTTTVTVTRTVTTAAKPGPGAQASSQRFFGTIVSITRANPKEYILVLKPAFFLNGVTAATAYEKSIGTTCAPLSCVGPPNDYWVNAAGSDLTFILPVKTKGTVVTMNTANLSSPVTSDHLAAIARGGAGPASMEPLITGLWFSVRTDTVTSFAQQYRP